MNRMSHVNHQDPESTTGPVSIGATGILVRLVVTLLIAVVSLLIIRYVVF
jgi:hypothetical protein